ncbi:type II secretion system F family protein [Roseiconus lacunae]|uniref:type II secretion system F family protein n=1 Tax=Roseiconus lacunae TaxID=2605694 RepID=UPI001E3FFC11|nr:type II secretion system F family protein [Roseiconus lacunae]
MISVMDVSAFCLSSIVAGSIAWISRSSTTSVDPRAVVLTRLLVRRDKQNDIRIGGVSVQFDRWLESVLIRSGTKIDRLTFIVLLIAMTLIAGYVGWSLAIHPLIIGTICVAIVPTGLMIATLKMKLRLNKLESQFPTMLEVLSRATRAGENLENAFQIASESSEEPIRGELQHCVRQMRMGMPAEAVTADLAWRIDSTNAHLLSHCVAIHHSLGGKLAESLDRLSGVIQRRSDCEQKIKSMTSVGRFAILSIVLMGVFVLVYLVLAEPDYLNSLLESSLGHKLLAYAALSELVGLIWVAITLKSDL